MLSQKSTRRDRIILDSRETTLGLLTSSDGIMPMTIKKQAYELIKDAILYRRLKEGVIYSQDAICNELKISRTPVREALLELQQEGYVSIMRGKGIEVVPVTRKRAKDIVEARYYLELNGSRLAALRRTEDQLSAMRELWEQLKRKSIHSDVRTSYQLDRQFHRAIFSATGNSWMQEEIEKLRDNFLRVETQSAFSNPQQAMEVVSEHEKILLAIQAGDPDSAEAAMKNHLDKTAKRTVNHLAVDLTL